MRREAKWGWLIVVGAVSCAPSGDPGASGTLMEDAPEAAAPVLDLTALSPTDTVPGFPAWTKADWEILRKTVAWARDNGIDTLPIGQRIARIGETFVGTPYTPGTLDPPGAERLVIDLREFDCVTFVENVLVLAHFVREAPAGVLDRPERAMALYQEMLPVVRYRAGRLAGYPSRLHYFTDWLRDNESRGILELVTDDLGGVVDPEPISFMTAHRSSYRQLADDGAYAEIGRIEARLNETPRPFIPKDRVAGMSDRLQDGDVLAMASTVAGLDVAHTGIAIWKDGGVHLMNAPLVGKSVEISEKPVAERLAGIKSQDGLMVGRPLEAPLLGR